MPGFETLLYEEKDGVAWVTLNRPDVYNAFNAKMQGELHELWRVRRELIAIPRHHEDRCVNCRQPCRVPLRLQSLDACGESLQIVGRAG